MLFLSLKLLHIVLAIVAVGFNVTYGVLIGRARKVGVAELRFALRTVRFMDDYVANPCYGLLLLTGVGMVYVAGFPWSLKWIHGSLGLLIVLAALAAGAYTPTLRKQIVALDMGGPNDPQFVALSKRGAMLGGVMGIITLGIVALMVFKPG